MGATVFRAFIALFTTIAVLGSGCAGDRPWPAHPVAVASRELTSQRAITTIDVLPLDLQMWAEPGFEINLTDLRAAAELNIMNVALAALARGHYTTGALIDWNGDYPGGTAMSRDELVATVSALSGYGAAAAHSPGALPVPYLPARLGSQTGADATLYLGGWSYVTRPRESVASQILAGVAIALVVLTVVVLIAAITSDKSPKRNKARADHRAGSTGKLGRHPAFSASRGIEQVRHRSRPAPGVVDAFGRTFVHVGLHALDWGVDPALPHDGGEAQMYLEATLIDNRTGIALWHARQTFPANAVSAQDTARVARAMLDALPGRDEALAAAQ